MNNFSRRDLNLNNPWLQRLFFIVLIIFLGWFLLHQQQADLVYRVTGEELLRIKQECKELAETKIDWYNNLNIVEGSYQLENYGYSEYQGYCYAEILDSFGERNSKLLYNTTEGKEVFRRQWPKDIGWYEYDFDRIVLGRSRIIDFREF